MKKKKEDTGRCTKNSRVELIGLKKVAEDENLETRRLTGFDVMTSEKRVRI